MNLDIKGWLLPREQDKLFHLSRECVGSILEIGSWVGLSTVCMAKGILQSTPKKFISLDIFPTSDNFFEDNGIVYFRVSVDESPLTYCSKEEFDKNIKPILGVGVRETLDYNLKMYGVELLVEVLRGDILSFNPEDKFRFIFCDCCHNVKEVDRNLPKILSLGDDECIFAVHDSNKEIIEHIVDNGLCLLEVVEGLGVYRR